MDNDATEATPNIPEQDLNHDRILAELERQNKQHQQKQVQSLTDEDLRAMWESGAAQLAQDLEEDEKVLSLLSQNNTDAAEAELRRRGLYHGSDDLNEYPTTDAGQGEVIIHLYGDQLRYDHTRSKGAKDTWLVWDDHRWKRNLDGEPQRLTILAARKRHVAAVECKDEATQKRLCKWARVSEDNYRIESALQLASKMHPITSTIEQFDRKPWLLACKNGVVDLRTGQLQPGRRADMISKSTNVDYGPGTRCDRWLQFLDEVFREDADLILFIQKAVGYSLTGLTGEQCLFMCWGGGGNGKTRFFDVLANILGEYCEDIQFSALIETIDSDRRPSNDIAKLRGARLVTASETSEGKRLNEGRIKSLTGEDRITARFLFGEFFTYTPNYKLWLMVNHKPVIRGVDEAIWRRVRLIPFTAHFEPTQEPDLEEKLKGETSGILAWAVDGCLRWQSEGLGLPPAVKNATTTYRGESDILAAFLSERTTLEDTAQIRAGELYAAYKSWCEVNGERPVTGTAFGRQLGERGFDKVKTTHIHYLGLKLASLDS